MARPLARYREVFEQAGLVPEKSGNIFWLDGNNFHSVSMLSEKFTNTLESAPAADTCDEAVNVTCHLAP